PGIKAPYVLVLGPGTPPRQRLCWVLTAVGIMVVSWHNVHPYDHSGFAVIVGNILYANWGAERGHAVHNRANEASIINEKRLVLPHTPVSAFDAGSIDSAA
ncbi:unnamed protein product, partial [Ectocarpus sp. 12 AP-2014]